MELQTGPVKSDGGGIKNLGFLYIIGVDISGLWAVHLHYTEGLPEQVAGLDDKKDLPGEEHFFGSPPHPGPL